MNTLKYKVLKRYKKAETYLKNHPFWPSFLSNGGILAIMFIASVVFTVICAKNSLTDINPVLKVIDLSIQGDEKTELYKLGIYHDVNSDEQDLVFVEYGLTQKDRAYNYDEYKFETALKNAGLAYDKDSVLISELCFKTMDSHRVINSSHNLSIGQGNPYYFCVTDSISDLYYKQYNYCKRGMDTIAVFKNSFVGNFIANNKKNPYIYLNFIIDGGYTSDPEDAFVIFNIGPKKGDNRVSSTAVNILSVFPEPTYISPSSIIYEGDELAKLYRNNGFVFLGEDLSIKQKSDRNTFLWTVLFGTAIALTIDILVNLILKWRDILPKRRRKL